ncbi:MAG: Na-Ca exchanger/integrin-beta4 [Chthoniobacteraceae bacterium]|nr:Na-Ca exchanger/integrin-beta4 [Chthoniobacteraceae bacterium]
MLIECLEARIAPATIVVTSVADAGTGSLRQAIIDANQAQGGDEIIFDLPTAGSHTIVLHSALPVISDLLKLIAPAFEYANPPTIVLDGSHAGAADGLVIAANGCSIQGLIIHSFSGHGILISGNENQIGGNYIGLEASGDAAGPNGGDGIFITGDRNQIGGDGAYNSPHANRISGNAGNGLHLSGTASANQVMGNFIGTDRTGQIALGNEIGILIDGTSSGNIIGGNGSSTAANSVEGNRGVGIKIHSPGAANTIQGNRIGFHHVFQGEMAVANGSDGLQIIDAIGATISNNQIAGNLGSGITLRGGSGNTIFDNGIGYNDFSSLTIGNASDGLQIENSSGNILRGNIVGGNGGNGIVVRGAASDGNRLTGNYVGTDSFGAKIFGNKGDGILIDGATDTIIGTAEPTDPTRNYIALNHGSGIHLSGGASGTKVWGNYVGFGRFGDGIGGNALHGIFIDGADHSTIGIHSPNGNGDNAIAFSGLDGIRIEGANSIGNVIAANHIGMDPFSSASGSYYGNLGNGISILGAPGTEIGGGLAGEGAYPDGNGIMNSHGHGILVTGAAARDIIIRGNQIASNGLDGIHVSADAAGKLTVGSLTANNVVSGGIAIAAPRALTVSDASVLEGGNHLEETVSFMRFVVRLSEPSDAPVSVAYSTADDTANAASDYSALSGTLVFAPGETQKLLDVAITADRLHELSETFFLNVMNASGAAIADGQGVGTIQDDDLAGATPSLTIAATSAAEDSLAGVVFTVQLSFTPQQSVTVDYSTVQGSALPGADYRETVGTLVFQPGEFSKTIIVPLVNDSLKESNESFAVRLTNANGTIIGTDLAVATIFNDDLADATPTISANGRAARWTDVDGDLVTVKVSKGRLDAADFTLVPAGALGGFEFPELRLTNARLAGANITISAHPQDVDGDGDKDGNRLVNVGVIDATGVDLGAVRIAGALGQIKAGDWIASMPALKSLAVESLGQFADSSELPADVMLRSELAGKLGKLLVKGSFDHAAFIVSGDIGFVHVKQSLVNGSIVSSGAIKTLTIDGDLRNGAVRAATTIGAVTIGGDLVGDEENPARLTAAGGVPAYGAPALTIKSLHVGGSVQFAEILAGYDGGAPVRGDVAIGPVTVRGDWFASSLIAGIDRGADGKFGTSDDAILSAQTDTLSRLAAITIRGAVRATDAASSFAFSAETISAFKLGATAVPLTRFLDDLFAGPSFDLHVREFAAEP